MESCTNIQTKVSSCSKVMKIENTRILQFWYIWEHCFFLAKTVRCQKTHFVYSSPCLLSTHYVLYNYNLFNNAQGSRLGVPCFSTHHLSRENTKEQLSTLWIHITKYKNVQHNFTSLNAFTNYIFMFMFYLTLSIESFFSNSSFVYYIFYKHLVFIVNSGSEPRKQWPWTYNHFVFNCFNNRNRQTVSQSNEHYMFVVSSVFFLTTSRFG